VRDALEPVARLEAESPAHDFVFDGSLDRLEAAGALTAQGRARLVEAASGGDALSWRELVGAVDPADPAVAVWDFVSDSAAAS
jgi:hypothetical protein